MDSEEDLNVMFEENLRKYNCQVPIKNLGDGYFMFGTKKIYAKTINGQLVVRVGGGYMVIDEFIENYIEAEEQKVQKKIQRGEDPFASNSPMSFAEKKKSTKSPRSRRNRGNNK